MILQHHEFTEAQKGVGWHKIISVVEVVVNGNRVIAPIEIDAEAKTAKSRIDTNHVSTYFEKSTFNEMLREAVAKENIGETGFFYVDKNRAMQLFKRAGTNCPKTLNKADNSNIIIRNIREKVNTKFKNITQTQQFKRFFGDWENNPQKASKAVDENGEPLILYHQTDSDFTVFDTSSPVAGRNDSETPNGIFLKHGNFDIGLGKNQMPLYASIRNPLHFENRAQAAEFWKKNVSGYAQEAMAIDETDAKYTKITDDIDARIDAIYEKIWREDGNFEFPQEYTDLDNQEGKIIEKWKEETNEYRRAAKALLDEYFKKSDYDGMILDDDGSRNGHTVKTYIVFDSTQVKSATNNLGTFDRTNPDINYSLDVDDVFNEYDYVDMPQVRETVEELKTHLNNLAYFKLSRQDTLNMADHLLNEYSSKYDREELAEELRMTITFSIDNRAWKEYNNRNRERYPIRQEE